jgi:hypothetical protein
MRIKSYFFFVAVFFWIQPVFGAEMKTNAVVGNEAETFYLKGMDSFLQGDYDKAILYTAKSLQISSDYKKAQNLLSVLVVEKEQGTQTEIWLGDRTRVAPLPVTTVVSPDLTEVNNKLKNLGIRVKRIEAGDREKQLERRVQVIAEMLQKSAKDDYQELKTTQNISIEKINQLAKGQSGFGRSLFWLFALVALSLLLSVWSILIKKKGSSPRLNVE